MKGYLNFPEATAAAIDPSYRLVPADRGKRIRARIKLLRPGYVTSVAVVKRAGRVC